MDSIPEGMQNFIELCENVVQKLVAGEKLLQDHLELQLLNVVGYNLDDIINSISKYKDESLTSPRVKQFLKQCENIRQVLDSYKTLPYDTNTRYIAQILCSGKLTSSKKVIIGSGCDSEEILSFDECSVSKPIAREPTGSPFIDFPSMCISCSEKKEEPSSCPCGTCYRKPSPTDSVESYELEISPNEVTCEKATNTSESDLQMKHKAQVLSKNQPGLGGGSKVRSRQCDDSLGYFEDHSKKIIKVTRYKDADGTIKEETNIINIHRQKHDPSETVMAEDTTSEALLEADAISEEFK